MKPPYPAEAQEGQVDVPADANDVPYRQPAE